MQRPWVGRLVGLVCAGVVLASTSARAIYLDEDQNITLRARIYSQVGIRLEKSSIDTFPVTERGQLIQHRNFFNPELDAKLTPYTTWMRDTWLSWLAPDDLRFRVAGWGFYDGVYDYGSSQFNEAQKKINASFNPINPPKITPRDVAQGARREGSWFIESPEINPLGQTFDEIFPGYELQNMRDIYANQRRVNELYLSYSKGPVFLRIGRQSISWGESDTIALLDQSNPFDVTLGAPGLFQDVDEARIPLWTVRASYNLFDVLGPFSSAFIESYWVPGDLDINTGIVPILGASPYSPRGPDPQENPLLKNLQPQFVLVDHVPKKRFENSRWGFRLQTVLNRFFTLQAWIYRTFPQAPVPRKVGLPGRTGFPTMNGDPGPTGTQCAFPDNDSTCLFIVEIVHRLTTVYGIAGTFFLEPLDSIIRINAQYFENEPGFIPDENLLIGVNALLGDGTVPRQDVLRYEVGLDRFFFFRPLNPTNSFVLVASVVGSWNLDETGRKDFRFSGQVKPGKQLKIPSGPDVKDFVPAKTVEAQAQVTLQTDYMHGRIQPRLTVAGWTRGSYFINPNVTYRWSDWLLFSMSYVHLGGDYQSVGFFRDRDQITFRTTYQLN